MAIGTDGRFGLSNRFDSGGIFPPEQVEQARQPDGVATRRHESERGLRGNAPGENSQRSPLPQNNTMRTRIAQLFNTKKVPYPPALQFGGINGDWNNDVAQEICANWVDSQLAHNASTVSYLALSKMKALEYERKNRKSIPEGDLLFPEHSKKKDYYEAEIKAFLEAVGEKDANEVLESFKRVGTGGLHRQHATFAATASNAVGAAALMVPDISTKAGLYGARLFLQLITAERMLDAGPRRLRNSGTEDAVPLGRADAAPSAKDAPNVLQASHAALWKLLGAEKNVRKMNEAMDELNEACEACETSRTPENRHRVGEARKKMEMVFAKVCYQIAVKARYKASSESAKIEWRGNQRYLYSSYTGTGLTLGAGLFAIMTPTVGGAVTGGVAAAAAAIALAAYIIYQLSSGPSKDGEAKAKRAIVALSKSMDVLSGDNVKTLKKRADAYEKYLEDRKAVRFAMPAEKARAKEKAKDDLLKRLQEITQEDETEVKAEVENNLMDLEKNWKEYGKYKPSLSKIEEAISKIENDAIAEGMPAAQVSEQKKQFEDELKQLEDEFQAEHKASFSAKNIADAWKVPMRIRMDTASRLLKGKVARSHKRLIKSHKLLIGLSPHAIWRKEGIEREIERIKKELGKNLLDMFNLELALGRMKPLIDGKSPDRDAIIASAADAIGAIEDKDVRDVFCGDARAQVEAVNKAKILTAGEAERYTYTNAGIVAVGIGLNVGVGAVDVGFSAAEADGAVVKGFDTPNPDGLTRIPMYNDHKFLAISQAGAQPAAHMSSGDRAPFQNREMKNLLKIIANEGNAVELQMGLADNNRSYFDKNGADITESINALVEKFLKEDSVPEKITLSIAPPQAPDGAGPSRPVMAAENLTVDLRTTSAYHRVRYKNASWRKKFAFKMGQTAIIGRQALMSVGGPFAQGFAQISLKKTRTALNEGTARSRDVRKLLAQSLAVTASDTKPNQEHVASSSGARPRTNAFVDLRQLQREVTSLKQANAARTIQNVFRSKKIAQQNNEIAKLQAQAAQLQKKIAELGPAGAARAIRSGLGHIQQKDQIDTLRAENEQLQKKGPSLTIQPKQSNYKWLKNLGKLVAVGRKSSTTVS